MKEKKGDINQRRIKNKYTSVLFSFVASLGRHGNKAMGEEMQSAAEEY